MEHNKELYDTIAFESKLETCDESILGDLHDEAYPIPSVARLDAIRDGLDRYFAKRVITDNVRNAIITVWQTR